MHLMHVHPGSAAPAIRIEVEASRPSPEQLALHYIVAGDVEAIRFPPAAPPERADGLWRHTCFEAFVRPSADAGYWELNFAPSRRWAVYRFSDYREGMAAAEDVPPPRIEAVSEGGRYELTVMADFGAAFGLLAELPWQVCLAAVIEDRAGRTSHWALAHPPGAPDFHHEDCFALELPPPRRP